MKFTFFLLMIYIVYTFSIAIDRRIVLVENNLRHFVNFTNRENKVYNVLEMLKEYKAPSLSVAVIVNGKISWAKAYGK